MRANDGPVVDAAVTTFEVLEAVRTLDDPGVSEIARHLSRSKSGVHKHLTTLTGRGYLTRSGDGYAVGLGAWALGAGVADRYPLEQGRRTVESLAASIGHSVALVVYEDGRAYYAYRNRSGSVGDRVGGVGDRVPLHASAAGKAILAYLPAERRDELLETAARSAYTDRTITDADDLRSHLETVRNRRTALEREERADSVVGVAAPITEGPDVPVGALAVAATADDLDGDLEGRIASLIVNASRSVENAIATE